MSSANTSGVGDRKTSIATGYKGADASKDNDAEDNKNKPMTATKVCKEDLKIVHSMA